MLRKSILYCGTILKLVASFLPTSFCSCVYRLESTLPSMALRRSSYRLQRNNNVDLAKKCTPRPDFSKMSFAEQALSQNHALGSLRVTPLTRIHQSPLIDLTQPCFLYCTVSSSSSRGQTSVRASVCSKPIASTQ